MLVDGPAGLDAAGLLAALHGRCFPPGQRWTAPAMRELLLMPGCVGWIASDREPLGLALLRIAADEGELLTLGVLPERRGAGHGAQLLRTACALAADRGAARMLLEVADTNRAALSLYRRTGFNRAGLRRRYYPDGADALVLAAALPLPPLSDG